MLILSRKNGQRIMIGRDIVLTVVGTSAGRCEIGIDAPLSVEVHREEVIARIEREKAAADARREVRT